MIDLASCMTVKSAEYKAHKRNALEVSTPDTTFLMFADTEKEKDDWYGRAARAACRARARARRVCSKRPPLSGLPRIGAIGRAIVRCSSTFTNDDGMEDGEEDNDD